MFRLAHITEQKYDRVLVKIKSWRCHRLIWKSLIFTIHGIIINTKNNEEQYIIKLLVKKKVEYNNNFLKYLNKAS